MDPITAGALITGGAALVGGVFQNIGNQREAQKNRQFQAEQSSTAYQRQMADMKAAGLNPMLAMGGHGASTPGGAQAHMENVLSPAVSSALETTRLKKEIKAVDSQAKLNDAQELAAMSHKMLNDTTAKKVDADQRLTEAITQEKQALLPAIKQKAKLEEEAAKLNKKTLEYDHVMDRIHREAGSVGNVLNPFRFLNRGKNPVKKGTTEITIDNKTGEIINERKP